MSQIQILDKQTDLIVGLYDNDLAQKWFDEDTHKDSIKNYEVFDFTANGRIPEAAFLTGQNRLIIEGDRPNEWREFVIWSTFKTGGTIEVKSNGSYVEMNKNRIIETVTDQLLAVSPEEALQFTLQGTEWQMGRVDYAGAINITTTEYMGAYEFLTIVAREFGMELHFRVEVSGNKIVGRYVDMLLAVGMNNGKEIIFGKDLMGIEREEVSEIFTAFVVQGPEREDGTRPTVTVENDEARQRWGREGRHLWGYHEVQSENREMSMAELNTYALKWLNKHLENVVSYSATAVGLEHVLGLAHEKVVKGDWVRIKDEHYSPPLYMEARVIEVNRRPSSPKSKTFVLGEIIEYTEDEIMATFRQLQKDLANKVGRDEIIDIVEGQTIVKSAMQPENPSLNLLWLDTSTIPNRLYRWDGGQWIKSTPTNPADVGAETPEQVQARINVLRDAIGVDIGELSDALTDFEEEINTTFADGIIQEAEAKSIEKYKNTVNKEKADVDIRYTTVYGNVFLLGTPKTNLSSAKTAFNTAHTNLINSIDAAIADGKTTTTEKADVDAKFAAYRTASATISQRFDQALDAIQKAQSADTTGKGTAVLRLQMELGAISDTSRELGVEVTELQNNSWLVGNPILTTLGTVQTAFNAKGNELYTAIQNAISDGAITQVEQQTIDALRTQYRTEMDKLIKQIRLAEDEVIRVSANEVIEFGERLIHKGSNFPENPQELDLWLDNFDFPPTWRQYINGMWTNVTRTNMADMQGRITETQIGIDAVTTPAIKANSIIGEHIQANIINSNMIVTAGLDAGVIKFGTMTGITADVSQAGMTAQGTTASSIRFWAGTTYGNRANAPFRVTQGGAVYASDITITGGSLTGVNAQFGGTNNQYGVVAVYNADGELTAELNGQFGGFSRLNVEHLVAPNKVEYADFRENRLELFVATVENTSGFIIGPPSDENSGLTRFEPLKTIGEAIRRIPKAFDGFVDIILTNSSNAAQVYNENVYLSGFNGDGIITLRSNSLTATATINGIVRAERNTSKTNMQYLRINSPETSYGVIFQQAHGIMDECYVNGAGGGLTTVGVMALNNAGIEVYRTRFENMSVCIRAQYGGSVNSIDCTGKGTAYAFQAWEGGLVSGSSNAPTGGTANTHEFRGGLIRGSWSYPTPPAPPAPAPVQTTQQWTSNSDSGSWRADEGRWDIYGTSVNNVTQGSYGGYGPFTGSWFFGTGVANTVSGKSIKKIRVYVSRVSGGTYASQNAVFRPHTSASRPGGNVSVQSPSHTAGLAVGESRWITLPTSFHAGFQSGSYKGITVNGGNYVKFSKNARLEITYV